MAITRKLRELRHFQRLLHATVLGLEPFGLDPSVHLNIWSTCVLSRANLAKMIY